MLVRKRRCWYSSRIAHAQEVRALKAVVWIMSALLILCIVVPTVLLGLYVAPWFFLGLVLLAVVPIFFLNRRNA